MEIAACSSSANVTHAITVCVVISVGVSIKGLAFSTGICFTHVHFIDQPLFHQPGVGILLILPSDIPVTGFAFVGKWVKLTACLQAGLLALLGDRPNSEKEWGICVICCEDQICLTYFSFAQNILGLLELQYGSYLWSNLLFIKFSVVTNYLRDNMQGASFPTYLQSSERDLISFLLSLVSGLHRKHLAVLARMLTKCKEMCLA